MQANTKPLLIVFRQPTPFCHVEYFQSLFSGRRTKRPTALWNVGRLGFPHPAISGGMFFLQSVIMDTSRVSDPVELVKPTGESHFLNKIHRGMWKTINDAGGETILYTIHRGMSPLEKIPAGLQFQFTGVELTGSLTRDVLSDRYSTLTRSL